MIFIIILLLYFAIGTMLAWIARIRFYRRSIEEFFVGGYRLGGFIAAMTYAATTYSAFMMIGLVGLTYATGLAALGFELSYLGSTIGILTIVGPYIWRLSRERRWLSPSEMLSDLYGSNTVGIAISIIYLFAMTPYVAAQLKGIGEIFNALGINYIYGVGFAAILNILWILIAGLWSVAITDAFQGIWMLIGALITISWLYLFLLPSSNININTFISTLSNSSSGNILSFTWSMSTFIGFTIPWIFFAVTNPQVVQRLYMPRDRDAYKRMIKLFSLYGLIYTLICVSLGLGFRFYTSTVLRDLEQLLLRNRDSVTPYMLQFSHPIIASIVYVSIIAAAISTTDSIILSVSSCIVRDIYERIYGGRSENIKRILSWMSNIVILVIATVIAIYRISYVVDLSVTTSVILLPLAPITIVGIYRRPGRRGLYSFYTSIAIGLVIAIYSLYLYGPTTKFLASPLLLGLPAPLWILLLSSIPLIKLVIK